MGYFGEYLRNQPGPDLDKIKSAGENLEKFKLEIGREKEIGSEGRYKKVVKIDKNFTNNQLLVNYKEVDKDYPGLKKGDLKLIIKKIKEDSLGLEKVSRAENIAAVRKELDENSRYQVLFEREGGAKDQKKEFFELENNGAKFETFLELVKKTDLKDIIVDFFDKVDKSIDSNLDAA